VRIVAASMFVILLFALSERTNLKNNLAYEIAKNKAIGIFYDQTSLEADKCKERMYTLGGQNNELRQKLETKKQEIELCENLQAAFQKDRQKIGGDLNTCNSKESRLYNALLIITLLFTSAVLLRAINIKKLEQKMQNELNETKKELKKVKVENSELIEEINALEEEMDYKSSDESSSSSDREDTDETQSSEDEDE
ncbi:hypothetical protein PFISCL1PPCAC_24714, partial [Pristionchus fissidentatus]